MLYAPGINCHEETAFSVDYAGGQGEIVLLADLLEGRRRLDDYVGLVIPGGFSYGDHLAAGRVLAIHLIARLKEELRAFTASGRPVLGICNGDQILMETGLLPNGNVGERASALTQNRSARFESRWVRLQVQETGTFWTRGLEGRILRMPVAHGEGRVVRTPDAQLMPAFLYVDSEGKPTEEYPDNPATSPGGIAGLVDPSGLVLGMMPHPDRSLLPAHGSTDGLAIFQNLVSYCATL
ncbi:MAG TPA: phosphoribosylformylglycinamidine synthase I [Armatimonadetes bacterium]|nr:phosphoribosylformylglycinamidine synthase I [Armatimonadota bacterium]